MRAKDKPVFAKAAESLGLWILVRRTNPASLIYIGMSGYRPKPVDCKAKTAECGSLAGLVVSPELCPDAFYPQRLPTAQTAWTEFCADHGIGQADSKYTVQDDPTLERFGVVRLQGQLLHSEYDLYEIIDPSAAARSVSAVEALLGQPHRRATNVAQITKFINKQLRVNALQFGGDAKHKDHTQQAIDVFGPQRQEQTITNEFMAPAWFRSQFRPPATQ